MGRAIDLFVTYRFLKLLTTPFEKVDAYKYGIIDKDGNRVKKKNSDEVAVDLTTSQLKNSYTILHKLVFNIKKIFAKVPGLRTKVGTYAAALFLLKDTFKEEVENADVFEKEFVKYLKENNEEEELTAKEGDKVITFEDEAPVDTVLGVDIFAVIHEKSKEKIYVSLEDIKSA